MIERLAGIYVTLYSLSCIWMVYRDSRCIHRQDRIDALQRAHDNDKETLIKNCENERQATKYWAEKWVESQTELKALKATQDVTEGEK